MPVPVFALPAAGAPVPGFLGLGCPELVFPVPEWVGKLAFELPASGSMETMLRTRVASLVSSVLVSPVRGAWATTSSCTSKGVTDKFKSACTRIKARAKSLAVR